MTSHLNRERQSFKELFYGYRDRERKAKFMYICTRTYLGFHEKGFLSYLCALGIDRQSPLNECTLLEPFIWNPMYYKMNLLNVFHVMFERRKDITFSIISGIFNSFTKKINFASSFREHQKRINDSTIQLNSIWVESRVNKLISNDLSVYF